MTIIEKYQKGVGLVYKERTELEHQDPSNPAIRVGYELVWHLKRYTP